jgi:hypothetical protein
MKGELEKLVPTPLSSGGWVRISRAPRMLEVLEKRLDRIRDKGIARELRDREERAPWQARFEQARRDGSATNAFAAFDLQLDEFSAHQVAPSLALPGSGSLRKLAAAWNAVCTEDPRLSPVR